MNAFGDEKPMEFLFDRKLVPFGEDICRRRAQEEGWGFAKRVNSSQSVL